MCGTLTSFFDGISYFSGLTMMNACLQNYYQDLCQYVSAAMSDDDVAMWNNDDVRVLSVSSLFCLHRFYILVVGGGNTKVFFI